MSTVLFSMPVHEGNEIILGTIANVRRFNGLQHHFMLHVDANWDGFDESIGSLPGVHINPERWPTQHAHSQIPTHLSNFRRAKQLGLEFDYFAILHTSEMFVRRGMHDHIHGTDHSVWFTPENQPYNLSWPPLANAVSRTMFRDLFDPREMGNYLGNLIEGSWWRRELMQEMSDWTDRHYSLQDLQLPYSAEECYFPTLAWHLSGGGKHAHPYCAFHHADHYLINRELVDDIRAGKQVTFWQPHNFVYDYAPFPSEGLFSVKRVSRDQYDPIRVYISFLPT